MDLLAAIIAICFIESSDRYTVINVSDGGSASYGWCQVKYTTAKDLGFKGHITELWFNKEVNRKYATKYLAQQFKKYGNMELAISAYNCGSVKRNKQGVLVNQKYVDKVYSHIENKQIKK